MNTELMKVVQQGEAFAVHGFRLCRFDRGERA